MKAPMKKKSPMGKTPSKGKKANPFTAKADKAQDAKMGKKMGKGY